MALEATRYVCTWTGFGGTVFCTRDFRSFAAAKVARSQAVASGWALEVQDTRQGSLCRDVNGKPVVMTLCPEHHAQWREAFLNVTHAARDPREIIAEQEASALKLFSDENANDKTQRPAAPHLHSFGPKRP